MDTILLLMRILITGVVVLLMLAALACVVLACWDAFTRNDPES